MAFAPSTARAQVPDPDDLEDRWHVPFDGGSFAVSFSVAASRIHAIDRDLWHLHGEAVVQIPLDRLFAHQKPHFQEDPMSTKSWMVVLPSALAVAGVATAKESPPKKVAPASSASGAASGSASASQAFSTTSVSAPSAAGYVSVTAPLAAVPPLKGAMIHALVVAAWKVAGVDRDDVLDSLATRARTSALLPELRLRTYRTYDAGVRVYRTEDVTTLDGASTHVEARMTFRLDRLVFADEEIAIERIRVERAELKQRIATRVVDLSLRFQKARRAAADPTLLESERDEAAIAAVEAVVALDAMTGGAASALFFHPTP
jgi:hypothetical protein